MEINVLKGQFIISLNLNKVNLNIMDLADYQRACNHKNYKNWQQHQKN